VPDLAVAPPRVTEVEKALHRYRQADRHDQDAEIDENPAVLEELDYRRVRAHQLTSTKKSNDPSQKLTWPFLRRSAMAAPPAASGNGSGPGVRRPRGPPARAPRRARCSPAVRPARSAAAASRERCRAPSAARGCPVSGFLRGPRGPRPARARRGTRAKRCKRWWASFALSSLGLPRALPLLQVGYPLRHGARLARRQLLVALIVLHGLLGVLQVEIVEDARVEMRVSIIRLDGERLLVVAACVVELALAPRYHAELVVVGGAIRVEADRFPERIERLRRPAGAPVEDAEVRLRSGEPRL